MRMGLEDRTAGGVFQLLEHAGLVPGGGRSLNPIRRSRAVNVAQRYRSGWSRKNAQISSVALMLWVVGPMNHSGTGPPPGHVCPPPLIV